MWRRIALWAGIDLLLVSLALYVAFLLRFDGVLPPRYLPVFWRALVLAIGIKIPVFVLFRTHRFSWRHVGFTELYWTVVASLVGSAGLTAVVFLLQHFGPWGSIPRSILGIDFAFTLVGVIGARLSGRVARYLVFRRSQGKGKERALVVGAGDAAAQLVRAIRDESGSRYRILGYVDDDPHKRGMILHGVRVLGPRAELPRLIAAREISVVLIAMPTAPSEVIRETVELARGAGLQDVKIVPYLSELYSGRVTPAELREVRPEDLLKREPVRVETAAIKDFLHEQTVLVTGAAGSIGSEICRQVLRFGARRLVALDFDETELFYLQEELDRRFPNRGSSVEVADVRDARRIASVFADVRPDVVYHAAAYKHVPMMEEFPCEAVKTNVRGTRNVLEEACRSNCRAFVLISTDKAVRPTSVMGATKRVAEMLVRNCANHPKTRCVAVRFGNVLGSRGSVLGTFKEQIEQRSAITITHPDMKRYFMITAEAVQLVLQASVIGRGGEVLVLDMGEPVRIVDFAEDLIRFYGLEPGHDVPIVYTGVRRGEKLFEELLTAEEGTDTTSHERLFVARMGAPAADWMRHLTELEQAAEAEDVEAVRKALRTLVPRYRS